EQILEPELEPDLESEPELEPELQPETEAETEPEQILEPELEPDLESEPELEPELQPEAEAETEPELILEPELEPELQPEPEPEAISYDEINKLIDMGFIRKSAKQYEDAVRNFALACELTRDAELKYLLTMEILNLYKDLGRYEEAENLLNINIYNGKNNLQPDIINEMNRQLSFMRILRAELSRLSIPDTPLAKVPRLVQLNVSAKMQQEEADEGSL
ncbi:MAG: hypothetical protein PHF24_09590, partial [Syntrophomonas sp.]|nr:hypothetical protein [Syntrophomonas sp.]